MATNASRFTGKVVIVTGGASGIGLATAQAFDAEGASVLVVDLHGDKAREAASMLKNGAAFACDVGDAAQVEAAVAEAVKLFGGLDIMFNNAATVQHGSAPITDTPSDELMRVLRINVSSVFNGIKFAAPHIAARGGGSIISTASTAGLRGVAGVATYASSKAAVISLTQTAALELMASKIRVNAICPGNTKTPIWGEAGHEEFAGPVDKLTVARQARWGFPADIAGAVISLASDDMSFVSGQAIAVDNSASANLF